MEFHEFPKSLYKDGDRLADHRVVANAEEEKDAREAGYRMLGEPAPAEKKAKK